MVEFSDEGEMLEKEVVQVGEARDYVKWRRGLRTQQGLERCRCWKRRWWWECVGLETRRWRGGLRIVVEFREEKNLLEE